MATEDNTGHLTGDGVGSEEKTFESESCIQTDVNEPQDNLSEQEKAETHKVEMNDDQLLKQPSDVDHETGPETDRLTKTNEEKESSADEMAECTEDVVIAKVEDFANQMAVDEDHDERMEEEEPDDAGEMLDKNIKSEKSEPSTIQTQPVLKPQVKVKDEPMDEGYEKTSAVVRPVGNIKDEPETAAEFNPAADSIKISAVFSVGGNPVSVGAPAGNAAKTQTAPAAPFRPLAPANALGVICTGCNKVLLKGQTAFQRKGCPKLFCSPQCLCSTSNMTVKMAPKKQCHHCLKEIPDLKDVVNAPVDISGSVKEFCSQACVNANLKCPVCQKSGAAYTHEVNYKGFIVKLCSESCFNQFSSSNKLNTHNCVHCGGHCIGTDAQCPSLQIEDKVLKFCKSLCLANFKKKSLKPTICKICNIMRPIAEMVEGMNIKGIRELFCSASCVTAHKVHTVSTSGAPVECNSCKQTLVPQYHLAMSDGTIKNFCSFPCVVSYQESFNKTKPIHQVNMVTSTTNNTSTPIPAPPKPAVSESSTSTKTSAAQAPVQTITKIPCSHCLITFFHKPELLEFKRKMYAFCGSACVEEFKQTNSVMARCEYCKIDKIVKEVKRINKIDRSFCSEGCKLLYKHDLVKRWGRKHCRNCFYCNGSAQTVFKEVVDTVEQEFCGNACLSQHRSLKLKELKCAMCRQAKMMSETVKWLGEIRHFCSLQCLMFFCSLQGTTGTIRPANKPAPTQGTSPAPSPAPQSTSNRISTKEPTPLIANVISLSNVSNGQPAVLANSVLQASVPIATSKKSGNATSTQTDGAKSSAPAPRILKNKALLCKPLSQNKGTSCKPKVCDTDTQTEGPSVIILPVPVPVYVPVPMNLYTQYTPKSLGLPLPVPVPLFFPTTLDSAESIVQTIQEIKEKIPDDPLEADLIMMAEMVAEDTEKEKHSDQGGNLMADFDLEAPSSNLSWDQDSVSSAQTWDQTPEPERPPPSRSDTMTPIFNTEEPQMDLEADFPIESIELLREPTGKVTAPVGKRKSRKRPRDGFPQKKRGRKSAAAIPEKSTFNNPSDLSKLQPEYGITAWRDWVRWRNAQPNMVTPKFGSRSMTLKEDLLKCCTAELSYGLCKFISEVRRPNGDKYSPDSIFYLCLGIQQYLFENNRMENLFADVFYTKFCEEVTGILKGWNPTILPSGYVHSRVEEEYLWESKQLGAFSPCVLLNTLLYFFIKHFNYRTIEQHRLLSFGHLVRCSRSRGKTKVACLRFYPPKEGADTDSVPAKKRKEEEDDNETVYEIKENSENPLRCPVRLFEFYISKCSPSVRQRVSSFYLSPERSCVPNSPMWFSTNALNDEALDGMITRLLTVRELHLDREKTPDHSNSDSDSDVSP